MSQSSSRPHQEGAITPPATANATKQRAHGKRVGRAIQHASVAFGGAFIIFTVAYWLVELPVRVWHWPLGGYVRFMLSAASALFLTALTGAALHAMDVGGRLDGHRLWWDALLRTLTEIGRGNFKARVEVGGGSVDPRHPWYQLVTTVEDMAKGLEQIEYMREEFIANVSHEIQTPLTSILGFVRALKSDNLQPEERQHYLDVIELESRRLSRLSDNLLKLTSLESGQHPFVKERYRLDRQLREVMLACEPLWLEKALDIVVSLPAMDVTADKELLRQVWMNLISNAIKFTDPCGRITVKLEPQGDWIEVSISDTGIGIGPDDLPHIFDRFYKADKSRGERPGSGLGLSIVRTNCGDARGGSARQQPAGRGDHRDGTDSTRQPSRSVTHAALGCTAVDPFSHVSAVVHQC